MDMKNSKIFKAGVSIALLTSVAGCLGNGTGGGAGAAAGGGSAGYEAAFDEASGRAPTGDMPTSLNAKYTGQMKVGVNYGDTDLFGTGADPQMYEIIGDVDVDVAWTQGMAGNMFSGTASNFVATEAGTSNSAPLTGTLTVDQGEPQTLDRTTIPAQVVMGQNIPEQNIGAFTFTMTGQLSASGETADTYLGMGGSFFGPGATAMVGTVAGGVKAVGSQNPQLFDAGVGGTFYATQ